ncbi:MAG: hypothetical protein AAF497_01235 [Planctomycetota bacterium]
MATADATPQIALKKWSQWIVGFIVFVSCVAVLVWLSSICYRHYDDLAVYHIEGLLTMYLLALGMATLAAPFFAESASSAPGDAPTNLVQALQLYVGVTGITFVALCVVFTLLWILGWVLVLASLGKVWFKRAVLGSYR